MTEQMAKTVLALGLVASMGITVSARDDDPRDFRRNNAQNDNRYGSDRDRDNRDRDRDDDDRQVTICHKVDRDDDDNDDRRVPRFSFKTITVSQDSLRAHLRHGDTLGPCAQSPSRPGRPDRDRDD